MKLFSVVLLVALCCIIGFNFIFTATDMPAYVSKLLVWLLSCAFPIIIIALGCYCVQMKDSGMFVRVILAYMIFSIIISACVTFIPLSDLSLGLYEFMLGVNSFLSQTQVYVFAYVLLAMIRPNNIICNTFKKIALWTLVVIIVIQVYLYIKMALVDKLPNVYGYDGFNFATIAETAAFTYKVVLASIFVEIFSIILTFITNYAFEVETLESEHIDFDELKRQADMIALNKFQNIYAQPEPQAIAPDRSVSEATGMMNVSNQLGADSNVGKIVNPSAVEPTTQFEVGIPTSNGPVVNDSVGTNTNMTVNNNNVNTTTNTNMQN
jgi:hypothetical protein